jgi:hypothetical protein
MNAGELLVRCRDLGFDLVAEGEAIVLEAVDPSAELLAALAAHKPELLALLRELPPWDQVEADRLLGELRSEVARIEATFGACPPAPLAPLLDDAIAIGERYIRDHELEAARGWDALELLRDLVPHVRELVARCTQTNAKK